jgi:putative membrane protein
MADSSKEAARQTRLAADRTTMTAEMTDSADRRTELAATRTVLAAERTYASWTQLGLGALAAGIGSRKLLEGLVADWMIFGTGMMLVLFSAFCFGAAVWRNLSPGVPPPRPDVQRLPAALLIAVNGFLALVSVAAMVGVWLGPATG